MIMVVTKILLKSTFHTDHAEELGYGMMILMSNFQKEHFVNMTLTLKVKSNIWNLKGLWSLFFSVKHQSTLFKQLELGLTIIMFQLQAITMRS